MAYNTLIVLLGVALLGTGAGLVGSFAVLRRRALLGDALAHAALPGLCLGFLVLGERNLAAMLAGAFFSGLLGIAVVALLCQFTRVRQDAAIGIVLSVFFGAGIVLSRLIQNMTSIIGSKAGLDSYILGKTAGIIAADVALIAGAAVTGVALVALLFKEFLLISFDVEFAQVQGWPARRIDLALTGLLALVVVIGLPAVGVVMMAALLILPGVTARFWTERLPSLLLLAAGIGAGVGLVGTALSASYDRLPAGPIITLVGTALFAVSALAAPRRGLVAAMIARLRDRWQADYAEVLRLLYDHAEGEIATTFEDICEAKSWSRLRVQRLLTAAAKQGDLDTAAAPIYTLSHRGRECAIEVVRRRRLWQLLMTEYPDLVSLANPMRADGIETLLPPAVVADLTAKLRQARRWPDAAGAQ